MKKVSVIVPVYNMEKYLDKCLQSLVDQTLKDIEIIVINDGSTDNTQKIIDRYYKKYPDLIVPFKNKNQGISKTRNFGIAKSRGEFISFIDSDDYVQKNFLEELYDRAIKDNLDIVVCDYYNFFESKNLLEVKKIVDFENTAVKDNLELLFKINSSPWNKLYKRNLITRSNYRFPENIKYEDLGYIPILLLEAKKVGKVNKPLNYYLIRGNSETTTIDKRVFDIFKILNILYDFFKKENIINSSEVEYLFIEKLTIYNLQQKLNKDIEVKKQFTEESFKYLNNFFPEWKNNKYFKKQSIFRYFIKKSKMLTNIYISIGGNHENNR